MFVSQQDFKKSTWIFLAYSRDLKLVWC